MSTLNVEALKRIGSEWVKADKHRIYFNDLTVWYGLECSYYNTGNVSSATLDGEHVSNCEARRILGRLGGSKVWYDFEDHKFHGRDIGQGDFNVIVKAIRAAAIEDHPVAANELVA
jgi:hypothetical protein